MLLYLQTKGQNYLYNCSWLFASKAGIYIWKWFPEQNEHKSNSLCPYIVRINVNILEN